MFHNEDYRVCLPSTDERLGLQFSIISPLLLPEKLGPEFYCVRGGTPGYIPKEVAVLSAFSFCGLWGAIACMLRDRIHAHLQQAGTGSHLVPRQFSSFHNGRNFITRNLFSTS